MCVFLCQRFKGTPVVPITTAPSGQIENALKNLHKRCMEAGGLQLLIIILPDVKGSYGE